MTEHDVSQLQDLLADDEDLFEFETSGQPKFQSSTRPRERFAVDQTRQGGASTPLDRRTDDRARYNRDLGTIPVQNKFATLFATSQPVDVPEAPNVKVVDVPHPMAVARRVFGWSQKDLAKHSGITLKTIQRFESGQSNPKLSTLRKLARTLVAPIDVISDS